MCAATFTLAVATIPTVSPASNLALNLSSAPQKVPEDVRQLSRSTPYNRAIRLTHTNSMVIVYVVIFTTTAVGTV